MPATPVHHTAVDTTTAWDGPEEETKLSSPISGAVGKGMYAWYDPKASDEDNDGFPDVKSGWKFPHHNVANGKPGAANLHGVNNAMARLDGSDIPDGDKAAVKKHLQAHQADAKPKGKQAHEESLIYFDEQGSVDHSFVLDAFIQTPWAILPEKLTLLEGVMVRYISGEKLSADEILAVVGDKTKKPTGRLINNKVAVLPLYGTIMPRGNVMTDISGGTSAELFGKQFMSLVDDPDISAIVLDVDSPGGQATGIDELSKMIFEARGAKPVVAVANYTMASAAYWIGSAVDELVAAPSAQVGSIGVFTVHQDISAALDKQGIKTTLIKAGKYKAESSEYQPLTDEAKANIQANVDDVYLQFVGSVARNRNTDAATVGEDFGQGRVVSAKQAVKSGMADRVATLDDVIQQLLDASSNNNLPRRSKSSSDEKRAEVASETRVSDVDDADEKSARLKREAQSLRDFANTIL